MVSCRWILLTLSLSAWAGVSADQLFSQGLAAEKAGDLERAYSLYAQAAATKPNNTKYWAKVQALIPMVNIMEASKMMLSGQQSSHAPASNTPASGAQDAQSDLVGTISDRDLEEARRPLPPIVVAASKGHKDFDIRGDGKAIVEQVVKAFGLSVIFDPQYKPVESRRFQLKDADFRDAMHAVEMATGTFFVPVSTRALFAANDTTQKRTEYDRDASIVLPIPDPMTVQEVQEILTAVRGVLEITRMMADPGRRLVLFRDRASKLRVAEELFHDLARPRAQVNVEVEVITTDVTSSLHYGLSLPTSFSLIATGTFSANLLQLVNPANYLTFGGGKSSLGFSLANASLFATLSKADSKTLLKSQVLTLDGQAASLHVGDKYPIATNLYLGNTSTTGQVYTPPPTFSFEDLGLSLKITPHVNGTEAVSLDITAEFKLLGATSFNGIPVVESTKYDSKVSVREGQWAVLSGLTTASEMRTVTGLPGLTSIPFLHDHTVSRDRGETLIVLKPHLVNLPPTEIETSAHWVGTETHPRTL